MAPLRVPRWEIALDREFVHCVRDSVHLEAHQDRQVEVQDISHTKEDMIVVEAVVGDTITQAEILEKHYRINEFDKSQVSKISPLKP